MSGRHCRNCRNDKVSRQAFASSIGKESDFPCPRGIAIGESVENIETIIPEIKKPTACRYRGELLQDGSCQCSKVWECQHPDMLFPDGSFSKQIGRSCGKGKCKGYVQS